VRRVVEKTSGSVLMVPDDRRIVLLYPLRHGSRIETVRDFCLRLIRQLQESWPDAAIQIGIGGIASGLNDVKRSFDEAQLAERALSAQVGRPDGGVIAWDDLGIVKLLLQANSQAHLGQFARQVLGRLLDYDRDHGAALVETLREYFAQGNNLEGTARALHLHPHSLRYRLQRVSEIAGLDLKDADSRLNVQVALKILDLSRTARLG
jgi:purine catabolism regulator